MNARITYDPADRAFTLHVSATSETEMALLCLFSQSARDGHTVSGTGSCLGDGVNVTERTLSIRSPKVEPAKPAVETDLVVTLRDIPREQAKAEVLEYYQALEAGRAVYPSDVANKLQLDAELARDLTMELTAEGDLEVAWPVLVWWCSRRNPPPFGAPAGTRFTLIPWARRGPLFSGASGG